jgi:hypothetical protein
MSTVPASPNSLSAYPAALSVDYPDRQLNRLTSFFRLIMVIPIGIILSLLSGSRNGGPGILFPATLLMILFRKKYPKWWFDWNLDLTRFTYRVVAYFTLLRDEYPSTDADQAVHLDLNYPDAQKELGRGWPLIKWFLAIPHIFILYFLVIAAVVCVIIAWFAILFTGRYPRGLFEYIVGVGRWLLRVQAYAFLLTTDKYPPFSLD